MVNVSIPLAAVVTLASSVSADSSVISNSTGSRRLATNKVSYSARSVDLGGNDIGQAKAPRADDCLAKCLALPGCLVYTWTNYEGGTCFLKTAWQDPKIYVGAESGVLLQAKDGQLARQYGASFSDCDMPGFDLGQARGILSNCDKMCWDNPQCKAVTWTNYLGGTCFFKSDVRECALVRGAVTIVVFNHLVTA